MIEGGRLAVTYLQPLDLSVDEMLADIQASVDHVGATRDGHVHTVLSIVKMRGSEHATDFRTYRLTPEGAVMGESPITLPQDHDGHAGARRR